MVNGKSMEYSIQKISIVYEITPAMILHKKYSLFTSSLKISFNFQIFLTCSYSDLVCKVSLITLFRCPNIEIPISNIFNSVFDYCFTELQKYSVPGNKICSI